MKILVLGLNYAPEIIGIGPYTTGLAEALVRAGHQVRVVAGQPYYPEWRARPGHGFWNLERRGRLDVLRVPHFIPRHPTGAMRLLHHFTFALAAFFPMLWAALLWRPDRVIAIAPGLMAAPVGLVAARLSGATAWLHVQDFELEAAEATGLIGRGWFLGKILRQIERGILCAFDHVSTISPAMCRRLEDKGVPVNRIAEHRNWAGVDRIVPQDEPSPYRALWGIGTEHVALYSGALGRKHGLDLILAAARQLSHRDDLTFVICGNGPDRAALEASASGLRNIRFHDLQPIEKLGDLLALATIHLLPQIACAQDLVLPSKLPNMLASGRPVVATASPHSALFQEVSGCGIATPPQDAVAFAQAIADLCDNPVLARQLGSAARARAEARWSRQVLLANFVGDIEQAEKAAAPAILGQRP
ncbi:hypothetical protein ASG47_09670 [Devosia sp. Leaf420]|uniref:WcaI family glycosyltransferase n=1 Tax=Devosia sp. Leaf420 TaxID=1736374 RepID=UPI000713D0E6|nr:WcaI family glycosyltransferase [Devosia sp. Leaf420]KQT46879.1 hypothetical protein ASG47_09670 [Devosia sp. Leaf420]